MSAARKPGTMTIDGDNIQRFRLHALHKALKLELVGLKRKGRSAYAIIKDELGIRGNRQSVYDQLTEMLENANVDKED